MKRDDLTVLDLLRDAQARIVRAHEFAADGEFDAALIVLEDLEFDVERALAEHARRAA